MKIIISVLSLFFINSIYALNEPDINLINPSPAIASVSIPSSYTFTIDNPSTSSMTYTAFSGIIAIPSGSSIVGLPIAVSNNLSSTVTTTMLGSRLVVDCSNFSPTDQLTVTFTLSYSCNFYNLNGIDATNASAPFNAPFMISMEDLSSPINFTIAGSGSPILSGIIPVSTNFPFLVDVSNSMVDHTQLVLPNHTYYKRHIYKNIGNEALDGSILYKDAYANYAPSSTKISNNPTSTPSQIFKANSSFSPASLAVFSNNSVSGLTSITASPAANFNTSLSEYSVGYVSSSANVIQMNEFIVIEEKLVSPANSCFTNGDVVSNSTLSWTHDNTLGASKCAIVATSGIQPDIMTNLKITGNTFICAGQSTNLQLQGANTYTITSGSGGTITGQTLIASPTVTTTYVISGNRGFGCTTTASVTVTVYPSLSASLTPSPASASICLGSTTSVGLSVSTSGGTPPFTYSWNPNTNLTGSGSSVTVSPTSNTDYTVTITDSKGCSILKTQSIQVNSAPNVNFSPSVFCLASGNNITAIPVSPSANASISYKWYNGSVNPANLVGTGISYKPTVSGTYILESTAGSCTALKSITIAPAISATIVGSNTINLCANSSASVTYNISGGSATTYDCKLKGSNGTIFTRTNVSSPVTFNFSPTSPEVFCLEDIVEHNPNPVNGGGCAIASNDCISINVLPEVSSFIGFYKECMPFPSAYNLPISFTGIPPFSFDIEEVGIGVIGSYTSASNDFIAPITVNPGGGVYRLVNLFGSSGCAGTNYGEINFDPTCTSGGGGGGGGTGGAGGGGASCVYIRMKDAQTSCPGGTVNINFELIDPLGLAVPSGLYNIEYAQINPSSGAIISGPFIVPHTVPGGTGPTYSFSLTHLGTITNNAYFVITDVTRAGGCPLPVSYGGVIAVTAHTNASGLIRINPEVVCIPGTITCTVFGASSMPSGNYDFKITENPGGALTLFSGLPLPHTFIRTLTAPAGSGSLRLHDLLNLTNGCMSGNLNTVNIIKESPITVTLTAGSQTICIGASTTLLGTISGLYSGQSITIILSDGTTKQITSNGAFSISVSPTATQVYSISGISGNKACTPTITVGSYTVNVVKPNPLSITASPMPICAGSSTTLTAVGFANSYQWFNGSTSLCSPCTNTISVTPAASPTVYNLVGTYTGCTVTSNATLAISTNSPPNPCNITFDKILCTGFMEFSVPAQSGVSYSWSAGPSADFEILYGNGSNKVMVARNPSSNALVGTVSVTITNSCGTSTCSYTFIMDCKCPQTESLPANAMSFNNATYNIGSQAAWNAIIGTNTTFVVNGKLTLNINSSTFGAGNYFHLHSFMFTPTSSFEFIMLPGSEIEFNSIGASTAGSNMVDIAYCNFRGYCELWKGLKFNCEDFSWSGGHLEIRDALYGINVAKPVIHFTSAYSDFIQCRHGINFSSNRDPNIAHQVSILGCNFGNLTGTRLPLMPSTLGLLPGSGPHYPYSGITALAITGQTGSEGSFNKGSSGAWYHLMYSLFRNLEIGIEENVMNSVTYSFFRITENQFKDLYTNSSGSSYNYNDGAAISLKRVSNFILETSILENIPNYAVKARVNYVSMDGNSFTNVNYNYDHSSAVPTVPDDYAAISIKSEKNTTNMAWAGFDIGYSGVPSSGNIFSNVTNLPGYRTVYGLSTALGGNTMLHDVDKYFQFSNNQVSNYQRGLYGRGCAGGIYIEDNALKLTDVISAGTNGERYGFDVRYCSGNSPFASFATIKNNIIQHSTGTSYKSVSSFGTGLVTGIIAGDNLTGATPSTAVNSVMIEGNKIYHLMRGIHIKDYLNAGRITCNYMENCYNGILLEGSSNTSNTFAIPVGTSDKLGNEWVYNNTSISLSDKIKHIGTSTQNTSTSGDWEYTLNPGLNPNYDPTINYPTTSFGASSVSGVTFVNVSATVDHPCIASGSAPSGSAPPQSYKVAGQQNFRDLGRETTDPIIRFSEGSQISASPNPTNGVVNIRYNVKYFNPDLSNISISDVAGKSLANIKSIVSEEGTITLDLTELVSGVYFVRLNNLKDQTEHRIKIIKH